MCPPGCYHNGFMATPELGHRMYGFIYIYIYIDIDIDKLQRSLEPTAHLLPLGRITKDSQSKPRQSVINCREIISDQGRTTF